MSVGLYLLDRDVFTVPTEEGLPVLFRRRGGGGEEEGEGSSDELEREHVHRCNLVVGLVGKT